MSARFAPLFSGALVIGCLVALPALAAADDDSAAKYSTKDVMKKAFKGPLLKKVASGGASEAEKKELHGMLVALSKKSQRRVMLKVGKN